jgi:hypothetical protein
MSTWVDAASLELSVSNTNFGGNHNAAARMRACGAGQGRLKAGFG